MTINTDGTNLNIVTDGYTLHSADLIVWQHSLFVNEEANANMTYGLTINQGTSNNQAFCLKQSQVNTGLTTLVLGTDAEIDDFFTIEQAKDSEGGAYIQVLGQDANQTPLIIETWGGDPAIGDSSSTLGAMNFFVGQHNGSNVGVNMAANSNAVAWGEITSGSRETRMILKADDGELHLGNSTLVALDAEEDALIVRAMQRESSHEGILDNQWDNPFYNYDKLKEFGLAGEKDKDDFFLFPLQSRLNAHEGAIWQTYCGLRDVQEIVDYQKEEIKSLKQELRLLKEAE